jgi:hypothetical protein
MDAKNYIKREVNIRELYTGKAKCEEVGDLVFFPLSRDPNRYARVAKKICSECPIINVCGSYGIQNLVQGIWGGMTPLERQKFRSKHNIIAREVEVA